MNEAAPAAAAVREIFYCRLLSVADGSSASARHWRKTGGPFLFDLPPALSDSRPDLSLCACRGNKAGPVNAAGERHPAV